jgi:hypothetical protein
MAKTKTNRISTLLTWARGKTRSPSTGSSRKGAPFERVATWADPTAYARVVQASYRRNKWLGQAHDVIVLSEKGTGAGRWQQRRGAVEYRGLRRVPRFT